FIFSSSAHSTLQLYTLSLHDALPISAALPEHAIVCDETISSGFRLFELTDGTAPHDYLPLTGGAIGIGPPLATGAAIACPDRKRSEEHTSELQSRENLVCRLLLEKKK